MATTLDTAAKQAEQRLAAAQVVVGVLIPLVAIAVAQITESIWYGVAALTIGSVIEYFLFKKRCGDRNG